MNPNESLKASQGNCGFKLQVNNEHPTVAFTIFLLRDGGISLASFAAPAMIAMAAFMCMF